LADNVFQPFQRLDDASGTRPNGLGLGLALAVAVAVGQGFHRGAGRPSQRGRYAGRRGHPCSQSDQGQVVSVVLVVDDELPILRTMAVNLRARGFEVQLVSSGRQALAMAARRHPDAVILDLGLADIDGIDVIHGLRRWTKVPIIVLSAPTAEAQKVMALDAGANDYLSKPFGMDELMARLRVALPAPAADAEIPVVETAMRAIRRKLEPGPGHPRYFITKPRPGLRSVPQGAGANLGEQPT
jgi:CheY-like chemotaxis protein